MCVRATIFSSKTTIDLPKYSHLFIQPTDITKKLDFLAVYHIRHDVSALLPLFVIIKKANFTFIQRIKTV